MPARARRVHRIRLAGRVWLAVGALAARIGCADWRRGGRCDGGPRDAHHASQTHQDLRSSRSFLPKCYPHTANAFALAGTFNPIVVPMFIVHGGAHRYLHGTRHAELGVPFHQLA
jgi:hypothetical protein